MRAVKVAGRAPVRCQSLTPRTVTHPPVLANANAHRRGVLNGLLASSATLLFSLPISGAAQSKQGDGVQYKDVSSGSGVVPREGEIVMIDVVGKLENGEVFLDTPTSGAPLVFQKGKTNKYVPAGLMQVIEDMKAGDVRSATVPPTLGYGKDGVTLKQGTVPANSTLQYEVTLLRCQTFDMGIACCAEEAFPCIKNKEAIPEVAKQ